MHLYDYFTSYEGSVSLLLTTVSFSLLLLFALSARVGRWRHRTVLVVAILIWLWEAYLIGGYSLGSEKDSVSVERTVGRGANVTISCLADHQLGCFGPQDKGELTYNNAPGYLIWIVLFAAFIAFIRTIEIRNSRSEPVTVQIENISDSAPDPGNPGSPESCNRAAICSAIMKRVVSFHVEAPPPVPGAEPALSIPTVLNEGSPRQGTIFTKFLALAWQTAFPQRGWQLTATIEHSRYSGGNTRYSRQPMTANPVARVDEVGITVQVRERSGLRNIAQLTYWRDSFQEACYDAAFGVARLALDHTHRIPEWVKWKSKAGRGLRYYTDGKRYARRGRFDEAKEVLKKAVSVDPGNALARAEYALVLEQTQNHIEALEIYLDLSYRYPKLIQGRYRAGVVMDLAEKWLQEWRDPDTSNSRKRLQAALVKAHYLDANSSIMNTSEAELVEYFLECSGKQFKGLRKDLRFHRRLRYWWPRETRSLFAGWIPGGRLCDISKAAIDAAISNQMLHVALNKSRADGGNGQHVPISELKERRDYNVAERKMKQAMYRRSIRKAGRHSRHNISNLRVQSGGSATLSSVHLAALPAYNAACFYARLVRTNSHGGWVLGSDEAAYDALTRLDQSLRQAELGTNWLRVLESDPDFEALKKHPVYKEWLLKRIYQD